MNHHFFKTILAGAFAAAMILGGAGCKKSPSVVNVSDISLSEESLELKIGETKQLDVSFYPENANKHPELVWESDNDKVATVSQEGLVSAMGSGKAVVRVATNDGSLSETCEVRVITKVTALSLGKSYYSLGNSYYCFWGGAASDYKINFTSTPSTAVPDDFIWEVDDKSIINLWTNEAGVYIQPLAGGLCKLTVTPKDGDESIAKTVDIEAYKNRFAVIPHAKNVDLGGTGIDDGATIDLSTVELKDGLPAIHIVEQASIDNFAFSFFGDTGFTIEDNGVIKLAEVRKVYKNKFSFEILLPLGNSGTAKMTIKNTLKTGDGSVGNTYTREFTLLVP